MRILKRRSPSLATKTLRVLTEYPAASAIIAAAGLMTAAAIVNRRLADKAQRDNPPQGHFIDIDGVRLHYVERGSGRPVVLFHGNGSMIQDFEFEWSHRPRGKRLSRYRVRSSGLRPQSEAPKRRVDPCSPSRSLQECAGSPWRRKGNRARTLLGSIGCDRFGDQTRCNG